MVTTGLLVHVEAQPGKDEEVEQFLASALPLAQAEPETTAWFAVRFGRSEYGIVDVFPDDGGRQAHLAGPIAAALGERAGELFASPPRIRPLDVLADKLPAPGTGTSTVTKGVLLTLPPKAGKEAEIAEFLKGAQPFVEDEPETVAWFAVRLDDGDYAIFDVFPDAGGRFKHLTGRVPRELVKHGLGLLGGVPDIDMLNILAHKLPE